MVEMAIALAAFMMVIEGLKVKRDFRRRGIVMIVSGLIGLGYNVAMMATSI